VFYLCVCLLSILAGFFVISTRFYRAPDQISRNEVNLAVYEEQLGEIEKEHTFNADQLRSETKRELILNASETPKETDEFYSGSGTGLLFSALILPFISLFIYFDFGLGRGAIADVDLAKALVNSDPSDKPSYRVFVQALEARAEVKPGDHDLQFLLARGYSELGRYDKAALKYRGLLDSFPMDSGLLSNYAGALFVASDRQMTEPVRVAVDKALKANPSDVSMMEIKAIASIAGGDERAALAWFKKALDTGLTGERADLIKAAMHGIRPGHEESEAGSAAFDEARKLEVGVDISETIYISSSSMVYVYARAANGPMVPLAVRKIPPESLPQTIVLTESMAMVEGMGLADFDEVVVVARLSQSGNVKKAIGDYEAISQVINFNEGYSPITLYLDSVVEE